jgi:hypothetical protein
LIAYEPDILKMYRLIAGAVLKKIKFIKPILLFGAGGVTR